jgi:HK97 family phage prohead protease
MAKKKNELVTRFYHLDLRADETEEGVIRGVPIVFDKPTTIHDWAGKFVEVIDRNALKNTNLKDVRLFVNHDIDKITLARSKNGKGTMSLVEKDDGLHMEARLDVENNYEAKALYSAIKRGDMDGMSFMFEIESDKWEGFDTDTPKRTVTGIKVVHEVSVVNFPAYADTVVSARSKEETSSVLEEARNAFLEETKQAKNEALELEKLKYNILSEV